MENVFSVIWFVLKMWAIILMLCSCYSLMKSILLQVAIRQTETPV